MKIKQHYSKCENCNTSNLFIDTDEVKKCKGCGRTVSLSSGVKNILVRERERLEKENV